MNKNILIIDGHNMFLRSYTVVPEMDSNGDHVGGIVGFIRSLRLSIEMFSPTHVIVVWDGQGGSSYRRGIYSEYKSGRKPRVNREYEFDETPERAAENMKQQFTKVKQYIDSLGVVQIELTDVEADDVIAYIAHHLYRETKKTIVSTDKDFYQLIDEHTSIYSPIQKVLYTPEELMKRFGILPENFIYMKMLDGDGSDKITGIEGIGKKTVIKLFPFLGERSSTLSEVLDFAEANKDKKEKYKQIAEQRERLVQNVKLMQLSLPVISPHATGMIRYALEGEVKEPSLSGMRLLLLRDGIQLKDMTIFSTFKEYRMRRNKVEETKNGQ